MILSGLLFLILIYARFEAEFSTINVLNSLFVTGILFFSGGILSVSNAKELFKGMGFTLRKMFTRKYGTMSYYEYLQTKQERRDLQPTGWPALFAGIIFLAVSIIFSIIEYL